MWNEIILVQGKSTIYQALFFSCHCIAYIYCFVASYLFSIWYDWFLWRYPMLLLGGIYHLFVLSNWNFLQSVSHQVLDCAYTICLYGRIEISCTFLKNWWFLSGVWVTASLLKSLGLFSVSCLISTMRKFGQSPLIIFISNSSNPCTNPLMTVTKTPITIGIIVTFLFHGFFFQFPSKVFSLSFNFTLWFAWTAKSKSLEVLSFLLLNGLAEIRWSVCISKSLRS